MTILRSILTLLCLVLSLASTSAGDVKLQARLVWGTDKEKPGDPHVRLLDAVTAEKLKKVFKWTDYYECHLETFSVGHNAPKKVKMSPKCEIEVQNFGKDGVEVKLFGEGKLIKKVKEEIPAGKILVIAGDDKRDNAWFVVLSTAP